MCFYLYLNILRNFLQVSMNHLPVRWLCCTARSPAPSARPPWGCHRRTARRLEPDRSIPSQSLRRCCCCCCRACVICCVCVCLCGFLSNFDQRKCKSLAAGSLTQDIMLILGGSELRGGHTNTMMGAQANKKKHDECGVNVESIDTIRWQNGGRLSYDHNVYDYSKNNMHQIHLLFPVVCSCRTELRSSCRDYRIFHKLPAIVHNFQCTWLKAVCLARDKVRKCNLSRRHTSKIRAHSTLHWLVNNIRLRNAYMCQARPVQSTCEWFGSTREDIDR